MLQLGPQTSSEATKTKYHCATLVGNWEEERKHFGVVPSKLPSDEPIDPHTTYTTSYRDFTPQEAGAAKPPGCFAADAPKELLFFHGDFTNPEKHQLALSELCYTDRKKVAYTNDETLDMPGVSRRRQRTNALRRTMGLAADGEDGAAAQGNAATLRESQYIRSLNTTTSAGGDSAVSNAEALEASRKGGYTPPALPPIGRVAERTRLLTTKQVTIDSTGEYLYDHLENYPLTSSTRFGDLVVSRDNPMHKTKLRVEYTLE